MIHYVIIAYCNIPERQVDDTTVVSPDPSIYAMGQAMPD